MARYTVSVRPARFGYVSAVAKKTQHVLPDDPKTGIPETYELGWGPEPSYWIPTKNWAIDRAERKRRTLMAQDKRRSSWKTP